MTDGQRDSSGLLPEAERVELERLRIEVAQLRDRVSSVEGEGSARPARVQGRRTWPRTLVGSVLIGLAALLAPLSVVAVWARSQVSDTDRYVQTVTPLASDPAVQQAITTNITNVVFQYLDVRGLTQQAVDALASSGRLPPAVADRLDGLVDPITNGVYNFTQDQVGNVVRSQAFADAWSAANRTAHESLVAALTGDTSGPVVVQGDAVSVQLATVIATVKQRLVDRGFTLAERIPAVNAQFTVFQSADLPKVQRGYRLLNTLGYWLPFIVLALGAIGVYVVPNHRRAFIAAGLALAGGMLLVAILLALVRRRYLNSVPADLLPPDAAAVLFDTVVRFLREALRAIALVGVVIAAGAFLTGRSVTATAVRRTATRAAVATRGGLSRLGLHMPGVSSWVGPRAGTLRAVAAAVAVVLLIVPAYLTPSTVAWVAVGLLAVLFVIAVLAAPEPPRSPGWTDLSAGAPVPAE
jgi:hypothetical protein